MSETERPPVFDTSKISDYIREALLLLPAECLDNLSYHMSAGHTFHAGPNAYKWAGVKSGCLLSLATSRETLADVLDFETKKRIEEPAMKLYSDLVHKIGLEFYIATSTIKPAELQQLVIDFIKEIGNNNQSTPEVTNGP